jgi:hypothetical protein
MSALARFERFMESLVEDSVARFFGSPIQPAEIAKRLERAMESHQTISVRRVIVPNFYRVYLNPKDFAAFQPIKTDVEREMATYLGDLATERNFSMLEHPKVVMAEDSTVPRRTIQVEVETAGAANDSSSTQVLSNTAQMQLRPQATSGAKLLVDTPAGQHAIPLESTLLSLGRGLDNDVILEDTRVSRHHAQLRYKTRRFWVTDLNSTNGTYINGERISEADLRHGDVLSLGGLELTFREA